MENKNFVDEINLKDYLDVIWRRKKTIAIIILIVVLVAFFRVLFKPPVYEAKSVLLIKTSSTVSPSLSSLAGLLGVNMGGGASIDDLTRILKSRAVAEKVFDDLDLSKRIKGWDNPEISRQNLINNVSKMAKVKASGSLMEIKVKNKDPILASDFANSFVKSLSYFWYKLNYTEAKKKKEYIEKQMPRVEIELKKAEKELKKMTLLTASSGGGFLGTMISQTGIELDRLNQEYDVQSSVYTMLRKEYESAKLEESKEIPPFSVIDEAIPPEKPIDSRLRMKTIMGFAFGVILGTFAAFFQEYWEKTYLKGKKNRASIFGPQ